MESPFMRDLARRLDRIETAGQSDDALYKAAEAALQRTRSHALHAAVIKDSAAAWLDRLGDSRDAVAATLADAGITGPVYDCTACPIAAWMEQGGYRHPSAGTSHVFVDTGDPEADCVSIPTPDPVARFILGFDGRMYPNLIKDDAAK